MNVKEISEKLSLIAKLLTITDDNPFKIRAFENASRAVLRIERFDEIIKENKLSSVKGIGKSIESVIRELYLTDTSKLLEELKSQVSEGIIDMLSLKGLGAKKIKELVNKLGITSIGELEYACNENRLTILKGFGAKTQQNILKSISKFKMREKVLHYPVAEKISISIINEIRKLKHVKKIAVTGERRRKTDIVHILEFVVETEDKKDFMSFLKNISKTEEITEKYIICRMNNTLCKFYFSEARDFHQMLFITTGSEKFLEFPEINNLNLSLKNEREFFKNSEIPFVPPECRENFLLPNYNNIINYADLKGLFHVHTTYSDGANSIEEIVKFLIEKGFQYVGISDHSKSAYYANGLSEDDIKKQHEEIDRLNEKYKPFKIFKGIESDILKNGDLDYKENILESFDFIIASVHSSFNMHEHDMTKRMVKAVENPYTTIIGHATGRLLLYRDAYELNIEKFLEAVAKNGKYIEINTHPYRLDLSWENSVKARELGIKLFINPDAHNLEGFSYIKYGINVARKAALKKDDIINTGTIEETEKILIQLKSPIASL